MDFAKKRNLEAEQDEMLNVVVRKKASPGYENSKSLIIQGHLDMVCLKEEGSTHDFTKDPISMYVEDDFLKAKGTTLGGDNGVAVAYGLALFDGDYKHPPFEVLFTTNEETGLDGVLGIKEGFIHGDMLLNADGEEEGLFQVSCSGGVTVDSYFEITEEEFAGKGLKITVRGLKGGHSGMMINEQRASANKVIFRLLNAIRSVTDIRIASIVGGDKVNAIPSTSVAEVLVADKEKAVKAVKEITESIKGEYYTKDRGLEVEIEDFESKKAYNKDVTDRLIDFVTAIPDGVVQVSKEIEGFVQTSLNSGTISVVDNNVWVSTSIRSSIESQLDMMTETMRSIAKMSKARFEQSNRYPAWQYQQDSPLRDLSLKVYKEMFGEDARVSAVHAGLEPGFLKKLLPNCDMLSYGPNIYDVHSPRERISISSTKRMWDYTLRLLEEMK